MLWSQSNSKSACLFGNHVCHSDLGASPGKVYHVGKPWGWATGGSRYPHKSGRISRDLPEWLYSHQIPASAKSHRKGPGPCRQALTFWGEKDQRIQLFLHLSLASELQNAFPLCDKSGNENRPRDLQRQLRLKPRVPGGFEHSPMPRSKVKPPSAAHPPLCSAPLFDSPIHPASN